MNKILIIFLALISTGISQECVICTKEFIDCEADSCGVETCTRIPQGCFECQELYCGEPIDCTKEPEDPCFTADCEGDCSIIPQTAKTCALARCVPVGCDSVICLISPEQSCEILACGTGRTCQLNGDQCCPEASCVADIGGDNATSTSSTSSTSSPTNTEDTSSAALSVQKGVKSLALVIATLAVGFVFV
jgi:hypothetical protein